MDAASVVTVAPGAETSSPRRVMNANEVFQFVSERLGSAKEVLGGRSGCKGSSHLAFLHQF